MDSLVCDLTNALNSNSSNILIRKKTFRQTSRKKLINRRKSFRRSDCAIVKTAINTHGSFSSKSNLKPPTESGSTYLGGKSCLSRVKISSSSNFKHSTNGSNFNLPSSPATSKALMDANSRVRRHNSLNSFSKSSSSSNLAGKSRSKLNKHRRIMSLLLAARASITKIQSTDTNDLSNLVRFNATTLNKLNGDVYLTKPSCKQSKIKKVYKIQKTYRFHANYRLHCIRLRRLQRRHHHHHHRHHHHQHRHHHHHHHHQGSHHHRNNTLTASSSSAIINENVSNMSSSTISTTTSNNSSSSSDLETSTSLAECYSMANLNINSDENCATKLNLCSKTTKPKIKKLNKKSNRRRNMSLLSYKHHRQHKQSNTNVKLASSSKKQLVEEVQSKLATEQKTDCKLSNPSSANLVDLKRGSFKRKRMNAHYSRVKRIYLRENESSDQALNEHEDENDDDDDDDDDYDDFSDSICSNLDESNEDKEAESNDEDKFKNKFKRIERYKKSNLAGVTMPIGSTCQMESDREENRRVEEFAGRRLHEEEDEIVNEQASIILKSEAEKTEADDEQSHSDWTPNECSFSNQQSVKPAINTVIPWWNEKNSLTQQEISLKSKSSSSYSNLSSSKNPKLNSKSTKDIDDDNLEDELDNDEDVDDEHEDDDEDEDEHEEEDDDDSNNRELDDSDQYNYEDEQQEQTEFKNIISGALSLMTKSSKLAYRKKLNKSKSNSRKKRYNSIASDYASIIKKPLGNLNPMQPINGDPIPESNIGNKMLKNMGWQPGTSLGNNISNTNNLIEPIVAIKRPGRVGLGYGVISTNAKSNQSS